MLTFAFPPKVNTRSLSGLRLEPSPVNAMWAAPITSADVPNSFDSRTRRRWDPIVGRTIMRMVWSLSGGSPGMPGNLTGACTDVPHAATQWPSLAAFWAADRSLLAKPMTSRNNARAADFFTQRLPKICGFTPAIGTRGGIEAPAAQRMATPLKMSCNWPELIAGVAPLCVATHDAKRFADSLISSSACPRK